MVGVRVERKRRKEIIKGRLDRGREVRRGVRKGGMEKMEGEEGGRE